MKRLRASRRCPSRSRPALKCTRRAVSLALLLSLLPAAAARAEIAVDDSRFFVEGFAGVDQNGDHVILDDEGERDERERSGALSYSDLVWTSTPFSRGKASQNSAVVRTDTTLSVFASGSCEGASEQDGESTQGYGNAGFDLRLTLTAPARLRFDGFISASEGGRAVVGTPGGGGEVTDASDSLGGDAALDPGTHFVSVLCTADTYFDVGFGGHRTASSTFSLTLSLIEGGGDCGGDVLTWVGGGSAAFGDPQSWSPPQVPVSREDGPCDTALVDARGPVTIDLSGSPASRGLEPLGVGRRIGRLVVDPTRGRLDLRTLGGPLAVDALSPLLGERSLEIGRNATLLLENEALTARHVAVGTSGEGAIEVAELGGLLETTGRLGLGQTGAGRLLVRDGGQVRSAEAVLGELEAQGSARVEGEASEWTTGNLAVGLEDDGALEIEAGGLVTSDAGVIGFTLQGDERGRATVRGKTPGGTSSSWQLASLEVQARGSLLVDEGGRTGVLGEIEVGSEGAEADCLRGAACVEVRDGFLGGLAVKVGAAGGGELRVGPEGELVALDQLAVGAEGTLGRVLLTGPSRVPSSLGPLAVATVVDSRGVLRLDGAQATAASFAIGGPAGSQGVLNLVGDPASPGATSLLADAGDFSTDSRIGGVSAAAAAEPVVATGTLELFHARLGVAGLASNLVVERLGRLESQGGRVEIQDPGALVNRGVVAGDLLLEGDYVQEPQGTMLGTVLAAPGPASAPQLSPLATAGFPRRALRAKPSLPSFGPMVVTGDATLAGRALLQFGNGVAPRAGDRYELFDVAGTVTGELEDVVIQGLAPGSYAFEPSLVNGRLTLTSLQDAVALPAVSVKAKRKLNETAKKGGKIKLTRSGDRSAPLVVHYLVGGTARSGADYEALPGTIEIAARKKSAAIVVRPIADGLLEGPETIELELLPGDGYAPGAVSSAAIELVGKDL